MTWLVAVCLSACSDDHASAKHANEASDAAMHATQPAPDAATPPSKPASAPDASGMDAALARHDAGNSPGTGGSPGSGGAPGTVGTGGSTATSGCDAPGLTWKTANKTNYTSYPDPGSEECIKYSGCEYEGMFAACDDTKPESWVKAHDIVAAFPDFDALRLHDLCLRSGSKTIVVTVVDTCGDSDCDGCCTENKGSADELIDVESYTDARWGVPDGRIEWADLGPTQGGGCQ